MVKHCIRIVGGHYRRTRIPVPDGPGLRPTPDRVRETLYNWLAHRWAGDFSGKQVLDLFAGSGALGFEAASRGVGFVQMVESDARAVAALRALRSKLGAGTVRIHAGDALTTLRRTRARYDLILLDPPFGQDWLPRIWPLLPACLQADGLVYAECEQTIAAPADWLELRQARAGTVHYGLWQRAVSSLEPAPSVYPSAHPLSGSSSEGQEPS